MPSVAYESVSDDEENKAHSKGLENVAPGYDQSVMDWATPKPVPQRPKAMSLAEPSPTAMGRSSSFSYPSVQDDARSIGLVRRATYNDIFVPGETPLTARGSDDCQRLSPTSLARRRTNTSADITDILSRERTHALNTLTAEKRSNSWSALVKQSSDNIFHQKNSETTSNSPSDSAYGSETQGLHHHLSHGQSGKHIGLLDGGESLTGSQPPPVSVAAVAPIRSDKEYSWQGSSHGSSREGERISVSQSTIATSVDPPYLLKTGAAGTNQYESSSQKASPSSSFTAINLPQEYSSHSHMGGHTLFIPNQQAQQMLLVSHQPVLANAGTSGGSLLVDTSLSQQDVNKWEALVKAKESMLRQKDQMIEKQKKAISELQQRQLEQDSRMFHVARSHNQPQDDMVTMRLQELQFENGQIRAQLADIVNKKDTEISNIRKKLGEREYEMQNIEGKFQDLALGQSNEIEDLQEKIAEKEVQLSNLLAQKESAIDKEKALRNEVEKLKAYLNDVPTTEEHKRVVKELKEIRDDYKKLKEVATAQQKKIADLKRALSTKSSSVKKLEEEKKELQDKCQQLEKAVDSYKKGGAVSELEVEEAKWETERIKMDLDRYKKLLENKHKKMKEMHDQSQATQKNLEERLAQEEDTVNALRSDLQLKEEKLEELRKSTKKLASQNQDLMEHNMNLEDACREYEKANSKEVSDAQRRLQFELTTCISDLKGLVELCTSRKEGEDPNMSALLGLRRSSAVEYDEDYEKFSTSQKTDPLSDVTTKLEKIKKIRSEVDNLRSFLSDKYAEDIGDQCHLQ